MDTISSFSFLGRKIWEDENKEGSKYCIKYREDRKIKRQNNRTGNDKEHSTNLFPKFPSVMFCIQLSQQVFRKYDS